jgi:hypothetical protein
MVSVPLAAIPIIGTNVPELTVAVTVSRYHPFPTDVIVFELFDALDPICDFVAVPSERSKITV